MHCTIKGFLLCQIKRSSLYHCSQLECLLSYFSSLCVLLEHSMLDPYAKEKLPRYGFLDIKDWKYCKHSHIFPKKHPDQLIKRQSDQVICFMKLNHGQVPAMVRVYFSPHPLVYPYYSVLAGPSNYRKPPQTTTNHRKPRQNTFEICFIICRRCYSVDNVMS